MCATHHYNLYEHFKIYLCPRALYPYKSCLENLWTHGKHVLLPQKTKLIALSSVPMYIFFVWDLFENKNVNIHSNWLYILLPQKKLAIHIYTGPKLITTKLCHLLLN